MSLVFCLFQTLRPPLRVDWMNYKVSNGIILRNVACNNKYAASFVNVIIMSGATDGKE